MWTASLLGCLSTVGPFQKEDPQRIRNQVGPVGTQTAKNIRRSKSDAQTSGGLLFTVGENEIDDLKIEFNKNREDVFIIGRITGKGNGKIEIRRR